MKHYGILLEQVCNLLHNVFLVLEQVANLLQLRNPVQHRNVTDGVANPVQHRQVCKRRSNVFLFAGAGLQPAP
jgi:hypothetical protein